MAQVGMHEAKTNLSRLVERAQAGEEITITRNGEPVAQLVAVERHGKIADILDSLHGQFHVAEDFDQLPDDLAEAFGVS